jgi:predicted SprT family Zn-dependent metalloprotease
MSPTNELYLPLINAYDHFNDQLFDGALAPVIFTLQRKKHVMGFFAAQRWGNIDGKTCSEIAINPSYFASSRLIEVMQTLVHEMAHAWQHHNKEWALQMAKIGLMPSDTGEPGGSITGRHMSDYILKNGRFLKAAETLIADESFTLLWVDRFALPKLHEPVVVDSTLSAGDQTSTDTLMAMSSGAGQDVIQPLNAHCHQEYPAMPQSLQDQLGDSFFIQEVAKRQTRQKYECPNCLNKVYGKRELNIICADCELPYVAKVSQ